MTNRGGREILFCLYLMFFPLCGARVIYGEEILSGSRHPFTSPGCKTSDVLRSRNHNTPPHRIEVRSFLDR